MDKIVVLDFGSQYTQLIARRVREIGVYCEIYPYDVDESYIKNFNAKGVILSGGPESVNESLHVRAPECIFSLNVPVLGVCNGFQILVESGLLPGVLLKNESLNFMCEWTNLVVENNKTPFTNQFKAMPYN